MGPLKSQEKLYTSSKRKFGGGPEREGGFGILPHVSLFLFPDAGHMLIVSLHDVFLLSRMLNAPQRYNRKPVKFNQGLDFLTFWQGSQGKQ